MRYSLAFTLPWSQSSFPGLNFELFTVSRGKFAGGGWAVRVAILSFALVLRFMPKYHQPYNMQAKVNT